MVGKADACFSVTSDSRLDEFKNRRRLTFEGNNVINSQVENFVLTGMQSRKSMSLFLV